MKQGKLVAFEGIDGSGKSTQSALLKIQLERIGTPAIISKAKPKDLDSIFDQFVNAFGLASDAIPFMFLYQCLHRRQYDISVEALASGTMVIADRWNPSYFVYHNLFGELSRRSKRLRRDLDSLAFCGKKPDVCFYLDIPVEEALHRRIGRGETIDRLTEGEFFTKIKGEYDRLAEEGGWHIIDGTLPIESVHKEVAATVLGLIR